MPAPLPNMRSWMTAGRSVVARTTAPCRVSASDSRARNYLHAHVCWTRRRMGHGCRPTVCPSSTVRMPSMLRPSLVILRWIKMHGQTTPIEWQTTCGRFSKTHSAGFKNHISHVSNSSETFNTEANSCRDYELCDYSLCSKSVGILYLLYLCLH